jgi:hypothetical protein
MLLLLDFFAGLSALLPAEIALRSTVEFSLSPNDPDEGIAAIDFRDLGRRCAVAGSVVSSLVAMIEQITPYYDYDE